LTSSLAIFEGVGLRSGRPSRVVCHARTGPFTVVAGGVAVERSAMTVVDTERATTVGIGPSQVATVEHLFAACGALGLHEGLCIDVAGGEVPLLDGGASAFVRGLESLALTRYAASLRVVRDASVAHGGSVYAFSRGATTLLDVELELDDPRLAAGASWDGSAGDFTTRIASARTFAFGHEVDALIASGRASHVDPGSVVVMTPDRILSAGAPFLADEPARHKLLDLIGDLFLYGGPPIGHVRAFRPGHGATHAIVRTALATGVLA
jgi:UDP-3-O-[3-hydroxymyristoyl] N-acetylglucosamine deacetylase